MTGRVQKFAILIGIDFLKNERLLRGAVRDVQMVKQYLEENHQEVRIHMFTASKPSDDHCDQPAENRALWPTFANVKRQLKEVTDKAGSGDHVHIHFSGHGVRCRSESEFSDKDQGNLALALCEDNDVGRRDLKGHILAKMLHCMIEKGIQITLTLDCCFSGSVLRHGEGIEGVRTISCRSDPMDRNTHVQPDEVDAGRVMRNTQMETHWMLDPAGYAILTAAGPNEYSGEYEEKDRPGVKYGALTFMLDLALRQCGSRTKFQALHQQIKGLFQERYPKQNPQFFGNQYLSYFEKLTPLQGAPSICTFRRGNYLYLDAGAAHGVAVGDEYEIYPPDLCERGGRSRRKARISAINALSSTLDVLDDGFDGTRVSTGWWAELLESRSPHKICVQLDVPAEERVDWLDISTKKRLFKWTIPDQDNTQYTFHLRCNMLAEYEILDTEGDRISLLPMIPRNKQNARGLVLQMLDHMTTFKFFQTLGNTHFESHPSSIFNVALTSSGEPFAINAFKKILEGEIVKLYIENLGKEDLYYSIFSLNPTYAIQHLGDKYETIPGETRRHIARINREAEPKKKTIKRFKSNIPNEIKEQGLSHCDDIIKIFITTRPSLFAQFWLPKITDQDLGTPGDVPQNLERRRRDLVDGQECDPLKGDWWARNFCIHVIAKGSNRCAKCID